MNVVIKVDEKTKKEMIEYYKDKLRDKTPPYAIFQAKDEDTIITLYNSGKVMFQGTSADIDAAHWGIEIENKTDKKQDLSKYDNLNTIGSDEVGTGDYFGSVVVTACYVEKDNIEKLKEIGVKDSKKLNDDIILNIAPKIIKLLEYESIILNPEEYNKYYNSTDFNFNKIKSILHNKVLYKLVNKIKSKNKKIDAIVVDEFAKENRYYMYVEEASNIQKGITFIPHAEDICISVAAASIISRYLFLKDLDKLMDKYSIIMPLGAGPEVDKMAKELISRYNTLNEQSEILKKVAKYNFKNTERVLGTKIM